MESSGNQSLVVRLLSLGEFAEAKFAEEKFDSHQHQIWED